MLLYSEYLGSNLQRNEKPENVLLLLHGYGSNGKDLLSIAPEFANIFQKTLFIAPNAPLRTEFIDEESYWWFSSYRKTDIEQLRTESSYAVNLLDEFIEQEICNKYRISKNKIAIAGFSQGAMLALSYSLNTMPELAGVISYCGMLIDPENIETNTISTPPVLLIHGKNDEVIDPFSSQMAFDLLSNLKIRCELQLIDNLAHGIDLKSIKLSIDFLHSVFHPN